MKNKTREDFLESKYCVGDVETEVTTRLNADLQARVQHQTEQNKTQKLRKFKSVHCKSQNPFIKAKSQQLT